MATAAGEGLVPNGQLPAQPYYPPGLSMPHYAPNTLPLWQLFAYFLSALGSFLGVLCVIAVLMKPQFRRASLSDKALFVWFTMCYFVMNHASLAGDQSFRAQLWKEYALSDSRYLTSDPFMLCVEGLTVVVHGTLSFAAAAAIVDGVGLPAGSSGLRHILQMLVSTVHLFGVLLYYGTLLFQEALQGASHCRPEFLYRWVYFGAMNAPWVVVPIYILYSSASQICQVFVAANGANTGKANRAEPTKKTQ
ncbi:hypothetical protein SCUCBS95973_009393 [Sporothrix curviconia]|uniref:EXPERA domain-containing protein n=1 Tax=Sporothrix curviconia TaxID=1260050 RepID=A0ABP0CUJ4_9PEZI